MKKIIGILLMGLGLLFIISQLASCANELMNPKPETPTLDDGGYYLGYQMGRLIFFISGLLLVWVGRKLSKNQTKE